MNDNHGQKQKLFVSDPRWRQLKDFALFLLAIVSIYSWLVRPATLAERVQSQLNESIKARQKYIPLIESHENRLTRLETRQEEQFDRIMSLVSAINSKMDR